MKALDLLRVIFLLDILIILMGLVQLSYLKICPARNIQPYMVRGFLPWRAFSMVGCDAGDHRACEFFLDPCPQFPVPW
jgi:hypothetical protein